MRDPERIPPTGAPDFTERLRSLYAAFNARDIDVVLAAMTADVDWPNAWEGGRLRGKDQVRDYWTRQWAEIDPRVEPTEFRTLRDGRVSVEVDQIVRDRSGALLSANTVRHLYTFSDGLVARMDVEPEVP
jgi:nuclear transport factor 2 (NTF2) superfamily protein